MAQHLHPHPAMLPNLLDVGPLPLVFQILSLFLSPFTKLNLEDYLFSIMGRQVTAEA